MNNFRIVDLTNAAENGGASLSRFLSPIIRPFYQNLSSRVDNGSSSSSPPEDMITDETPPEYSPAVGSNTSVISPSSITFNVVSTTEFAVTVKGGKAEDVSEIMDLFPSKRFDWSIKRWIFLLSEHEALKEALVRKKHLVNPISIDTLLLLHDYNRKEIDKKKRKDETLNAIPVHVLLDLAKFQREAVKFIIEKKGKALLLDDGNIGMSQAALASSVAFSEFWPVLIVSSTNSLSFWQAEVMEMLFPILVHKSELTIVEDNKHQLLKTQGKKKKSTANISKTLAKYKVVIISYEKVFELLEIYKDKYFQFIILDEIEKHLNYSHQNPQNPIISLINQMNHAVVLLKDQKIFNTLEQLFPIINAVDPINWPDYDLFTQKYCLNDSNPNMNNSMMETENSDSVNNVLELQVALTATSMFYRSRREISSQLPTKNRSLTRLQLLDKSETAVAHDKLYEIFHFEKVVKKMFELASVTTALQNSKKKGISHRSTQSDLILDSAEVNGKTLTDFQLEHKEMLIEFYSTSGERKLKMVLNHIEDYLNDSSNGKLVLFAQNENVLNGLCDFLEHRDENFIKITEETSSKDRVTLANQFQTVKSCQVAVISITAALNAINLTSAATLFFVELFWIPQALIQAEDRAIRIGQTMSLNIQYFVAEDTIDDLLWPFLKKKMELLGEPIPTWTEENTKDYSAEINHDTSDESHSESEINLLEGSRSFYGKRSSGSFKSHRKKKKKKLNQEPFSHSLEMLNALDDPDLLNIVHEIGISCYQNNSNVDFSDDQNPGIDIFLEPCTLAQNYIKQSEIRLSEMKKEQQNQEKNKNKKRATSTITSNSTSTKKKKEKTKRTTSSGKTKTHKKPSSKKKKTKNTIVDLLQNSEDENPSISKTQNNSQKPNNSRKSPTFQISTLPIHNPSSNEPINRGEKENPVVLNTGDSDIEDALIEFFATQHKTSIPTPIIGPSSPLIRAPTPVIHHVEDEGITVSLRDINNVESDIEERHEMSVDTPIVESRSNNTSHVDLTTEASNGLTSSFPMFVWSRLFPSTTTNDGNNGLNNSDAKKEASTEPSKEMEMEDSVELIQPIREIHDIESPTSPDAERPQTSNFNTSNSPSNNQSDTHHHHHNNINTQQGSSSRRNRMVEVLSDEEAEVVNIPEKETNLSTENVHLPDQESDSDSSIFGSSRRSTTRKNRNDHDVSFMFRETPVLATASTRISNSTSSRSSRRNSEENENLVGSERRRRPRKSRSPLIRQENDSPQVSIPNLGRTGSTTSVEHSREALAMGESLHANNFFSPGVSLRKSSKKSIGRSTVRYEMKQIHTLTETGEMGTVSIPVAKEVVELLSDDEGGEGSPERGRTPVQGEIGDQQETGDYELVDGELKPKIDPDDCIIM